MKVLLKAICLFLYVCSSVTIANASEESKKPGISNSRDSLTIGTNRDSLQTNDDTWPICPQIESSDLIILDDETYLLKWESSESHKIEYYVQVVDEGDVISEERNNTGIFIFQIESDRSTKNVSLNITTKCYYQFDKEPISSESYQVSWSELYKRSAHFCDAYEQLINTDELPSFFLFDTKFPVDVNFKFDICQGDDCHSYNHSISNSAILEKRRETYTIVNPKLLTEFGNFSCDLRSGGGDEICASIQVKELEACLYEVVIPEGLSPACDLTLYPHQTTNSLCGHPTGRIIVNAVNGNAPYYYTWSTGVEGWENDLNHLLPGSYSVTVTDITGCEVTSSATIYETTTVNFHANGGNGGLQESLTLPAGMDVVWEFNPLSVSDQLIVSGQNLDVNTGALTNLTAAQCQNSQSCNCSDVFMGDYNNGDALPILSGSAIKSYPYAQGVVTVPADGILNMDVIGANCGGSTGWSLRLDCLAGNQEMKPNDPNELFYVEIHEEVESYINAGIITREKFLQDSLTFYSRTQQFRKSSSSKIAKSSKSSTRSGNVFELDFRCSGFVAAPYTIRVLNEQTQHIIQCDIIDQVSCPECEDDTEGCEYIDYKLESDPWDPHCDFFWKVDPGFDVEMEIVNFDGDVVMQTSDPFGEWEFESYELYVVNFTLENDTLSTVCSFEIECPEPDLPPIDETICEFFAGFGVSLENESTLLFHSDNDPSLNQSQNWDLFLSQISQIHLGLNWKLGPPLGNHLLFDAQNGGNANLFQLDPQNMTFILSDYDMAAVWNSILQGVTYSPDQRVMRYGFIITDIYGNQTYCEFETIVEFPEEEPEEDNPLCLSCKDGVYDPFEDLEGYTLGQGVPYTGNLVGQTVHIYGFPVHITSYSTTFNTGEGILSLPFEECKVLAVQLSNLQVVELPIEKRLWIVDGEVIPHDNYPSNIPNFNIAPDFEVGAEICVPPRAPNDADGDGIDDNTGLDKYGFGPNGQHMNGTNFDNNGFDVNGFYMGCPRTDDPELDCTPYNDDGCDRDGKDEDGNPCPTIDSEQWDNFVNDYEESSDSLIAAIVCEYASNSNQEMQEKTDECDSLRTVMDGYIDEAGLSQKEIDLVKGPSEEYFKPGMSDRFTSEPKAPTPEIGGRIELVKKIEKVHVQLYHCDKELQPIEDEAGGLSDLCSQNNTSEIQSIIDDALDELSNLDKQRLMLDENAFQDWIQNLVKDYLKEEHNIYIGAVMPQGIPESFEIDLFNKPTKVHYQGYYNAVASSLNGADPVSDMNIMEAIDWEYRQGFEEINGVPRAYYVTQIGKYNQENFSSLAGMEPVAIQSIQQSSIFSIYLVNFRFHVNQPALVDAYIELADPKSDRKIYFSAKDIEYNPNGIESATMELATTIGKFKISNAARGTILKGPGTFLDFNCSGVTKFGLKGEVEFCDNIIVPMKQIQGKNDYERHDDPYFKMGFEVVFTEWLEFETQITTSSPFAMAKQEDLIWKVPSFVFDFSSSSSQFASGFDVPAGFNSEFLEGGSLGDGWKGFYCPSLTAVLPAITKSTAGDRFDALNVKNLLIDGHGVTCSAEVSTQILGLGQPNMKSASESSGWSLSIDYFRLDAVQNFIVGGGLRGQILTSLFKDDSQSALDYTAVILPGQKYKFSISPKVDLEVPLLVATAEIKSAAIDVTYDAATEAFEAQAKFNGNIKVDNNLAGASLPYLKFSNLTVMNKAPYISGGKWELKSNSGSGGNSNNDDDGSYKGFNFSLENLKFEECEGGPVLSTTINVGFGFNGNNNGGGQGETPNSNLNIAGDFGLRGKFEPNNIGLQMFKFESAFLNGLCINGNIGEAVKDIEVKLCWDDNNPAYGDTFYGSGKAKIMNFGEVGVAAQFGKKDGEKYFFIDAFAEIPTVPIGGPIGINMIGAGVSNNMKIKNDASGGGTPPEVPAAEVCSPPSCAANFGQTYTGFTYEFDASKALAMRLSVGFGMTTPPNDFIEGSAGLDVTFNDGGGIDRLGFFGEATILANFPDKLGKVVSFINESPVSKLDLVDLNTDPLDMSGAKPQFSSPMPIMARVEGSWDFGTNIFELKAGTFLDWGVLRGAGVDNALTQGRIYISPDEWNVSLGTPSNPSGVLFDLGIVSASFKTYFMAGNPLSEPWEPYLPQKVSDFFGGNTDFDFLETMPASGAGFAFGVHFAAGFNVSVPILGSAYADLMAGIDVAMVNGIKCNGNPIGFGSGWYAMGQAYLYAGAGLRILGVDLIKGEAGILMNAGLTQPSFFNGRLKVSGKFGVWPLRFTISGEIDVELGNEPSCDWYVYDPGQALEVLGEISIVENTIPATGSKDIATSLPEYIINYALPMGEVLELVYEDTLANGTIEDKTVQYKVDISRVEIISTKSGVIRDVNPTDDDDIDIIPIYSTFPSDDSVVVKITYNVNMQIPESDEFVEVLVGEVLEYNFTTGPLALRFEPDNIHYTWPHNGMDNFHLDHRLSYGGARKGLVSFLKRFPWEVFETPGIQVRSAIYQGSSSEPVFDSQIDPNQYFDVEGDPTNAGAIYYDLPNDLALGTNYKVSIYAKHDTSEVHIELMDPIHFRTSLYYNMEEKFAQPDSMYYVEASPRIGAELVDGVVQTYVCGFEYNLISNDNAEESWDAWDAKYMKFAPLCDWDPSRSRPKINSTNFVDCEFTQIDEPPSWNQAEAYAMTSVRDVLTVPSSSNLTNTNTSTTRIETGITNASINEVYFTYKAFESLHFKWGGFLLKYCD
ncbi:MAG: SprB repeat-containing protein [Bacteroidota bacterium]